MATAPALARFLSDAEVSAFMLALGSHAGRNAQRNLALFHVLANTGMRPSEALAMRLEDLHLEDPEPWIKVRRAAGRRGELQVSNDLRDVLASWAERVRAAGATLLFNIGKRQTERLFKSYALRAGIARPVCVYVLRHTAATRIYRATHRIDVVQAILGHESPDTAAIYAHVTRDVLADATRRVTAIV